ncbi:MAG: hypothetical protein KC731_37200 [Myxococcales bacterium]|nr:hypothetical protein [Myxococcales bacterium]
MSHAMDVQKRADASARALANQAFGTTGSGGKSREQLAKEIRSTAKPLSLATGFEEADVTGAMRQFMSKAGNIGKALELAPYLADVADATDAQLTDVGETAGQIFMSAIAQGMDEDKATQAVRDIMGVVAGQAKEGAIEMRDMATQMGKLMSAAGRFSGDVSDLANTMGAVGQLAIAGGASSPEEAMTALMRFASDTAKKGGERSFTKHGINVFTDASKTALRDPAQIIMESIVKTKGSMPELGKMFNERSIKAVEPFRKLFVEAGGGEAGVKAMQEAFARFTSLKMTQGEVTDSAGFRRQGDDKRMDLLKTKIDAALGPAAVRIVERLIPAFEKLVPHIEVAADKFAGFVEWFSANPIEGLGVMVLGKVAADLAGAGIGAAVKSMLVSLLSGQAATTAAAAGAPGAFAAVAGGGLSALLGMLAAPVALTTLGVMAAQDFRESMKDTKNFGAWWNIENPYAATADVTPEGREAMRRHVLKLSENGGFDATRTHTGDMGGSPVRSPGDIRGKFGAQPSALEAIRAEMGGATTKLEGAEKIDSAANKIGQAAKVFSEAASNMGGLNRGSSPTKPRG